MSLPEALLAPAETWERVAVESDFANVRRVAREFFSIWRRSPFFQTRSSVVLAGCNRLAAANAEPSTHGEFECHAHCPWSRSQQQLRCRVRQWLRVAE